MYSLVTPSVLVSDLACRLRGQRLLRLLEQVLLLDAAALPVLGDALLASDLTALQQARRAAYGAELAAPTYTTLVEQLQRELARVPGDPTATESAGTAARLARVPAGGGLRALVDFVATQALPVTGPDEPGLDERAAAEAAGDALTAVWAADDLTGQQRALLTAAWSSARTSCPRWQRDRRGALGPQADEVTALCGEVRRGDPALLSRLARAHAATTRWPQQMHEAAWTAHICGRLRAVTHAQVLAAAAVLGAAGGDPDPVLLRTALAPVLSAATALTLRDLLEDGAVDGLTAAWAGVRGG